MKMIEMKDEKG